MVLLFIIKGLMTSSTSGNPLGGVLACLGLLEGKALSAD